MVGRGAAVTFGFVSAAVAVYTASLVLPDYFQPSAVKPRSPIVIGHRGGMNDLPEHTLAAYELGMREGADFIEPDIAMTKDGQLVAVHDIELSSTTNVANVSEFTPRRKTLYVPGVGNMTGFFVMDFTLAELKSLRLHQRSEGRGTFFDDAYTIPTFSEVVDAVKRGRQSNGRKIGLYPEMKHAHFYTEMHEGKVDGQARLSYDFVSEFISFVNSCGIEREWLFIQCFDRSVLMRIATNTSYPLVQLVAGENSPMADSNELFGPLLLTAAGRTSLKQYAAGVGVAKSYLLLPSSGVLSPSRREQFGSGVEWMEDLKNAGLVVHAWTFGRDERELWNAYARQVDGVFADFVTVAVGVRFSFRLFVSGLPLSMTGGGLALASVGGALIVLFVIAIQCVFARADRSRK
eukprot:CAMPEP_0113884120 /NCGR_PEP_ID=MMETSP0780_2-20120614/10039_1 /TAXON_ID=652834 /ORGANISM="Palpitomonas bilix" /LENGTH=404 /DNA_ID=CAMNT_0000871621 /DNA_START=124 /DNA_END=1338 /DNA_ORIENTATION=- /assembly_acc=CAM_ASM_000599